MSENTYEFISSDVSLDNIKKKFYSDKISSLHDKKDSNYYEFDKFIYFFKKREFRGKNISVETNYLNKESDKLYFDDAFINFKNRNLISRDTKIFFHKTLFDDERNINDEEEKNVNSISKIDEDLFLGENDPRIYGVSANADDKKIILNNAIFTTCKKNDTCPPWHMKAKKITHDRIKKDIIYDNSTLYVYDFPVFYFPKFFHPDPSVKRRSGFLQPRLNNNDILGTSFNLPYFHVIDDNKDITFKPTIFDNRIYMFQNEYRQQNEKSFFLADLNYVKGYQSSLSNNNYSNRNSIGHLFAKYNLDLKLENFITSKADFFLEKVNNDTYLKVFEDVILVNEKLEDDLKDKNNLTSGFKLNLEHDNYNFETGITVYENLQKKNSDRFQYVFPYYNFTNTLFSSLKGSLDFDSNGRNVLSNTNNLKTNITNNLKYTTSGIYSENGFVNNFGIYFKNLNITGKNDTKYKSSLQSELHNIYEINSTLPLLKINKNNFDYLTPKISLRFNPSDMKNHSDSNRILTTQNIFEINRLGIGSSYESGKSLTLGLDYKKQSSENLDKYLEIKLAGILRDDEEEKIPTTSSTNRTASNLFGSIENSFTDFFSLNYNFAIDNDFNTVEHNSIQADLIINNFVTKFNFIEKNGEMGDTNTLENTSSYKFNENNILKFQTRRNRKISLTEYYDLVYEYKNDCLTAGIKYKKTYYKDRDLRSKEDLMLTITLFPFSALDQKVEESAWRGDNAIQNLFK